MRRTSNAGRIIHHVRWQFASEYALLCVPHLDCPFLLSHSLRVDQPCPTQINIRGRAPRKLSETPRFQKIQSHNVQDFFKWRRWLFSIILVLNKGGELVPRDEAPWQKFFFVACVVVTLHQPTMDQKLKLPTPLIDGLFFFLFFFSFFSLFCFPALRSEHGVCVWGLFCFDSGRHLACFTCSRTT